MADSLQNFVVADLCVGKPPLRPFSAPSVALRQALTTLKTCEENYISVCSCKNHHHQKDRGCVCIGKVCMVDIICFLLKKENLYCHGKALNSPLTVLLLPFQGVRHVEPSSSLLDVIELILEGAQNLVVPILSNSSNIESLGLVSLDFMAVSYDSPASVAIESISHSLAKQISLGVVDDNGILVGEISSFTLAWCDESVVAAIATLSVGELMAYIDCGGPPEDIVRVVKARLKQKNLEGMLGEFEFQYSNISFSNSSASLNSLSSEEDFSPFPPSLTTTVGRHGKYNRSRSSKMGRVEAIVFCHSDNSLVAVMTQAITRRVNYVWVIDDDYRLVGIVTFSKILEVFQKSLY